MKPDASAALIGLLAAVGLGAVVYLLTNAPRSHRMARNGSPRVRGRLRRNGKKGDSPTPRQQLLAERRSRGARKRDAAAQTRAARERARDARLTAADRRRGAEKVCATAKKRKARIRAHAKRVQKALDARTAKALLRASGRCAIARAETSRARGEVRDRRLAVVAARGDRSMLLEQRRRERAVSKEQQLSRDAIDSALSAGIAPTLVDEAARVWFTKSGRLRAPARAAARHLSRTKLFEAFQEWIGENENDLWDRANERAYQAPF